VKQATLQQWKGNEQTPVQTNQQTRIQIKQTKEASNCKAAADPSHYWWLELVVTAACLLNPAPWVLQMALLVHIQHV